MIYMPLKSPSLSNWTNVEQGAGPSDANFGGRVQKSDI